ncbi:MAG: glucose-1-phosphate adenylyltransferase subunit GlgD [Clostridiales bacterium]|jgi:glucose-1-phosphate adenylyltransferase|nr:glucose-1-phosphate adenylyltransferase subunit GlgD [Clostridiales bacterium]
MIASNSVLGIIFANMHDSTVSDLTKQRTMGSVLFGGRYRMIDFPLSNMVNSGIHEVGVITKANYQSLLDHVGSGREWDLSGKKGGLHLLPPFGHVGSGIYRGRIEALDGAWNFIEHSQAEYVLLSDCDTVTTIDYRPAIESHIESNADITAIYSKGFYNSAKNQSATVFGMDETGRVNDVMINPQMIGECNIGLNMFIMSKPFLKKIVKEAMSRSLYSFRRNILQGKKDEFKIMGYEHTGYYSKIDSLNSYYESNMALLDTEIRKKLFKQSAPIYTKVRDNGPVKYGLESKINNSLIADGCIIEGTVENCVLFRGVKVGKNTVVKNCILMQNTIVEDDCNLNYVITDKNVQVGKGRVITGSETYPLFIGKNATI